MRSWSHAAWRWRGAIALVLPVIAPAANFPDQPIKLIVPFGPGRTARRRGAHHRRVALRAISARSWSRTTSAPAARSPPGRSRPSPPDGYTLLAATAGSLAISPQLYKNAGIDPVKDFTAVALVSSAPLVLAVHYSVPARTVKELVAYAKANPGKLNYGAVIGTPPHLSGEMFKDHHRHQYRLRALQVRRAGRDRRAGRADEHDFRGHHRHRALSSSPANCGRLR